MPIGAARNAIIRPKTAAAAPVDTSLPRMIVLTDIGDDPDDQQSMTRLMLYANEINIVGLIAGSRYNVVPTTPQRSVIDGIIVNYAAVVGNLQAHDPGYPAASVLSATVMVGQTAPTVWGAGDDTDGSNHIIAMVDASDDPTHIAIWGGQVDLVQALFDAQNAKGGPSGPAFLEFLGKLRVYDIANQTGFSAQLRADYPTLRYVESTQSGTTAMFRGMYQSVSGSVNLVSPSAPDDASINQTAWLIANVTSNHGVLGAAYPNDVVQNPATTEGVKEGDTPSWLYLLHRGMSDPEEPTWGGWGGRFVSRGGGTNHYLDTALEDSPAHFLGSQDTSARRKYCVARWRRQVQMDFAARMDWCAQEFYANANHHPVPGVDGDINEAIVYRSVESGEVVTLSAIGSTNAAGAATGITYRWFQYREIGTYTSAVTLNNATSRDASFTAPSVGADSTIHFILAVTTTAAPELTRYRRVVVTVTPSGPGSVPGAMPVWNSEGTIYVNTTLAGSHTITVPAHSPNDLLILAVVVREVGFTSALNSINTAGWTQLGGAGVTFPAGTSQSTVAGGGWKIGDGTETSVSITCAGLTNGDVVKAQVHVIKATDGFAAVPVQGIASTNSISAAVDPIPMPTVVASGLRELAFCIVAVSGVPTIDAHATGETGGDWTHPAGAWTISGTLAQIGVQHAPLAGGGTITGGGINLSAAARCATLGFTIVPALV